MNRLRFADLFEEAAQRWRSDAGLLLRIASVFYFLPLLATIFIPPIKVDVQVDPQAQQTPEAAMRAWQSLIDGWVDVSPWLFLQGLPMLLGSAIIVTMLLAPNRPTLAQAIPQALSSFLMLFAASMLSTLIWCTSLIPLILPGLYFIGRLFLVVPLVVIERRSPIAAIVASVDRTRGHGWMLFGVCVVVQLTGLAAVILIQPLASPNSGSALMTALAFALTAMVGSVRELALVLVQVVAYRALSELRQGM